MQFKELILKKREGQSFSASEIQLLVDGVVGGAIPDYQISAWLMAVFFQGLSSEETDALTEAMWRSGESIPRGNASGFWLDKHSTGGVGDKPSLILVPLLISISRRLNLELRIPMISGRALGHSGGTLDKMESVPGFQVGLSIPEAMSRLNQNGYFMIGQTLDLAPADRKLYALRDAVSAVESVPLIVSSIMSKKLAESLDGLVFDIKVGSGAFMRDLEKARSLGLLLLEVSRRRGLKAAALLTRMDQPLGWTVGNALEVEECARFLRNENPEPQMRELVLLLATEMLGLSGKLDRESARAECEAELASGAAYAVLEEMFVAQGGDWNGFRRRTPGTETFIWNSPRDGYLTLIEARSIAHLVNRLGGGRVTKESAIDPEVGIEFFLKEGDRVAQGEPCLKVHHRQVSERGELERALSAAISIDDRAPEAAPVLLERLA